MGAVLRTEAISKRFGGLQALAEVSLSLQPGTIHALIGPNGAGKSTMLDVICGFTRASAGRVLLGDRDASAWKPHRIARAGIARTFQTPSLFAEMSAEENVLAALVQQQPIAPWAVLLAARPARGGRAPDWRGKAREHLALVGLEGKAESNARNLPYGERRLLEIARALATGPSILLLDEPAAGLNDDEVASLRPLLQRIAAGGISVLLIEHNIPLVMETAGHVTVLNFGRVIFSGEPADALKDPAVLSAYLGEEGEQVAPLS